MSAAKQAIIELLSPGNRFLDVGCGYGSEVIAAKTKYNELYGIDRDSQRISVATENAHKRGIDANFLKVDLEYPLPFDSEIFDTILCYSVLQYIYNPSDLLSEIHRILRNGGKFIVEVPNIAWLPYRTSILSGRFPKTGEARKTKNQFNFVNFSIQFFTKKSLGNLLLSKDFEVLKSYCTGKLAKVKRYWGSLLCSDIVFVCEKTRPHGDADLSPLRVAGS